ncbi:endoplasmic reticulum resident protein 27 [Rhinophrynus dorsalis]
MDQSSERVMERQKAWSTLTCLLLVLLARTSSGSEVGNVTINEESVRKAKDLKDISSAKAFIDSSEIAVIAFFEDLEAPEVEHFNVLVSKHPEWDYGVSTSKEVLKHFKIKSNTVSLFRKVDNKRDDLIIEDTPGINTEKFFRFLTINDLRLVTEYNPMTAIGIFASTVQIHMLLFMEKELENQGETLKEFREAAEELLGKALFVKVDIGIRGNEKVLSYFGLKKSDLPRVAIFNNEDESKEVMDTDDITVTSLKDFYVSFLSGKSTVSNH